MLDPRREEASTVAKTTAAPTTNDAYQRLDRTAVLWHVPPKRTQLRCSYLFFASKASQGPSGKHKLEMPTAKTRTVPYIAHRWI